MSLRRALTAAVGFVAAAGLALVGAAPAAADPTDLKILVLANPVVHDVDEEVAREIAAITPLGATITVFDGGDGSSQAWADALNGYDVLVLPELDEGEPFYEPGGGILTPDAVTTIKGWLEAGGWIFFHGAYPEADYTYAYFLSAMTGKDYTGALQTSDSIISAELQLPIDGAPPVLEYVDGTYTINPSAWSSDLVDGFVPIYNNLEGDTMVAQFGSQGSGSLIYIAYDWYPDDWSDDVEAKMAAWDQALRALIAQQEPGGYPAVAVVHAPVLADTGSSAGDTALSGMALAGVILLAGAALLVARRATAQ